jgi:hypothetical protein
MHSAMTELQTYPELVQAADPAYENGYLTRWRYLPLLFLIPTAICGLSWMMNGVSLLTDAGFILLTALCLIFLVREFVAFPRRFGIGGILLFGGVLVWFCHDYLWNWAGLSSAETSSKGLDSWVIAKSAFYHCLFITFMVIGLLIRRGVWLSKLLRAVPEPPGSGAYAAVLLVLFLFGISPYFIFTTDPWYVAFYKSIVGGRSAMGAEWTVGRTGNLNYSWGGYIAQIIEIGYISGIVGVFYAVLVAKSLPGKLFGWFCWLVWMALGFGTGARSQLALLGLPAIVFLYIAYQAKAAEGGRHSIRAYVYAGIIVLGTLVLVQVQATYRNTGFESVQLEDVELTKPKGNHMFSEGLLAFYMIPDANMYFYNQYPGQGLVVAMPNTIYRFILGPIPRALWNSKPIDPAWAWYNRITTGERQENYEGTTVALGLVGHWFARYGIFGVIQGGIFVGWLMRSAERAIQQNQGRKFALLLSVAFSAWIFALYRDINFSGLYPIIFAAVIMAMLIPLVRAFASPPPMGTPEYS